MDNTKIRRPEVSSTLTKPDRNESFTTLSLFVIALLAMAILASCSKKPVEGDRPFRIEGTVIDLANSRPIDSARVDHCQDNDLFDSTFTDTAGAFSLFYLTGGPPLKNLRVVVSKQGYTTFDTLFVRLDGKLTGWIVGLQRVQNIEQWDWRNGEYQDMPYDSSGACPVVLSRPPCRAVLHKDQR
jgi:hypothetical protein